MERHNSIVAPGSELTLSEVDRTSRNARARLGELVRLGRCGHALPAGSRRDARWCSDSCRQAAYRRRGRTGSDSPLPAGSGRSRAVDGEEQNHESDRARRRPPPIAARGRAHVVDAPHEHSPRLCITCTQARALELARAPRSRVNAELVAERIRQDRGELDGAAHAFGISENHAAAIRRGWRGAGRRAPAIPYSSRGYTNGRRNGWSSRTPLLRLLALEPGRRPPARRDPIPLGELGLR